MNYPFQKFSLACVLLLAGSGAAHSAPPRSALYAGAKHALFYFEHSHDPAAAAIRAEISQGSHALKAEQAAAQADGYSLNPARLQAPLPPESDNAAPVYVKLIALLKEKPLPLPAYADGMSTRHSYTPEQIAAAQKIYDSRPDVWDLVHQAADKPQCVFLRNWALGLDVKFPEFQTIRAAARLLETEGYLQEHQGHHKEAIQAAARGLRLAGHAGSDPTLISYLVGCACDAIALQSFSSLLLQAGTNPDVCQEVKEAIAANRPALSVRSALVGDTIGISSHLDQARMLLADDKQYPNLARKYPIFAIAAQDLPAFSAEDRRFLHLLWDAQQADYLRTMRSLIENVHAPAAIRNSAFEQPVASIEDSARDPVKLISNILAPVTARVPVNGERVHTQEEVLMASATALAAKARSGDLPASQTLTILDAFSDKPLLFRREGSDGFVLYSLGPDSSFDGGRPGDPRQPTQSYFRYPLGANPQDVLK